MTSRGSDESFRAGLTPDQLANLQDYSTTLEAAGVFGHAWLTLTGVSAPAVLSGSTVTVGVLDGLGVAPLLGRALREEDALPGAEPVLVLSESTWRRYFGAREDLVGQRIAFDDLHRRVVGVMPASFRFPSLAGPGISRNSLGDLAEAPEFWLPGPSFTRTGPATGFTILQAWALLKPGVSLEQAAAEIRSLAGTLPDGRRAPIEVTSARDEIGLPARRVLLIFQTGVSLILVIACVNVINLLLTRMAGRRHELALRVALGASRGRIAREGMTEALLLAVSGGAIGCLFAYALTDVLQSLPPHTLPRLRDIRVDTVVLGFALLVSIATGLGVGALSALRLGGADSSGGLHLRPAPGTTRQRRLRPSSILVVLEISAAMVLLTASGLLVNSFIRLVRVDLGYEPRGVVTFQVDLGRDRYDNGAAVTQFSERLSANLRGMRGVESVGAEDRGGIGSYEMSIDDRPVGKRSTWYRTVTPGYFSTLRLRVLQGREFLASDVRSQTKPVIVNEAFVNRYIADGAPVGRRIRWDDWFGTREIVGVVADSRRSFDATEAPMIYLVPNDSAGIRNLTVFMRTSTSPAVVMPGVREALRRLDPQLAAFNATTLEETLAHETATPWLHGLISLASAIAALLLAVIGLYGLLAYTVRARWNELGIRIALGASTRTVMRSVLRQGLTLTAIGLALGLIGSYLATRSLSGLLFGVAPDDAPTFFGMAALFTCTAIAACYIPARRATRVDPVVALRAE